MRYCFKGVKELILNDKKDQIVGCIGIKNEVITLQSEVPIKRLLSQESTLTMLDPPTLGEKVNIDITDWMSNFEKQLKWTMKTVIRRCIIERDDSHIEEWLYKQSFNE